MAGRSIFEIFIKTDNAEARLDKLGAKAKGVAASANLKVTADTSDAEKKVSRLGTILDTLKKGVAVAGVAAVGAGLTAGLADFIDQGSKFQSELKGLSALTGVTGAALDDLGDRARKSGIEFGTGAANNLIVYKGILSRLGPDVAKTPEVLQKISDSVNTLSKATGDTAEASMDAITTSLLQFSDEAARFPSKGDAALNFINVMAASAKEGAAEVPQIADAIKVAGVAASNARVSFVETNAALQALAQGGKVGAEAGTALRNVLATLGEGRFLPKEVQAELKAAGVDITKLADTSLSFTDRLGELNKVAGDSALVTKLFGKENAAAANILLRSISFQEDMQRKIAGTNAAFDQAATRQESFAETMNKLKAVGADLGISLFNLVEPIVTPFIKGLTAVAGFFSSIVSWVGRSKPAMIAIAGALSIVIGLLAVSAVKNFFGSFVAGTVQTALGIVQKLVPSLITQTTATAGATTAQLGLNTAMLATPVGILGIAIAGAVGAFALFGSSTKSVGDAISDVNEAHAEYQETLERASGMEKAAADSRKLADEYDVLSSKTDLNKEQQKRLEEITLELDSATGGAATRMNDYGEKVGIATGKVRALATEQENLAKKMKQDSFKNLVSQQQGLVVSLNDTSEKLGKLNTALDVYERTGTAVNRSILQSFSTSEDVANEQIQERAKLAKEFEEGIDAAAQQLFAFKDRSVAAVKLHFKAADGVAQRIVARFNELFELQQQGIKDTQGTSDDAAKKEIAKQESIAERLKRQAEEVAKQEEIRLRLLRLQEGSKFSEVDALAVAKARNKVLTDGAEQFKAALAALDVKEQKEFKLTIDDSEIKKLEAEQAVILKVKADAEALDKFKRELESKIFDTTNREIELGIKPKEAGLTLLQSKIRKLEAEVAATSLSIATDAAGIPVGVIDKTTQETIARNRALQNELLSAQRELNSLSTDLAKELAEARIGAMEEGQAKEIQLLNLQLAANLQFVRDALENDRELTQRELKLKEAIETKYQKDLLAIRKKFAEKASIEELSLAKLTADATRKIFESLTADRKKISKQEREEKQLGFDKDLNALEESLRKGEITQREFNVRFAKITADRQQFEAEQEDSLVARLIQAKDNALTFLGDRVGKYFDDLLQKYILDALFHEQAEQAKTDATLQGTSTRNAANEGSVGSEIIAGNASIFSAAAKVVGTFIATLPPPANFIAGLAAAFAIKTGLTALRKTLGFARGGAMVGEKGPELIFPAKDASHMIVSLVRSTAEATRQAIEGSGRARSRGRQKLDLSVRGRLRQRGRDLDYSIERDRVVRDRELLIPA